VARTSQHASLASLAEGRHHPGNEGRTTGHPFDSHRSTYMRLTLILADRVLCSVERAPHDGERLVLGIGVAVASLPGPELPGPELDGRHADPVHVDVAHEWETTRSGNPILAQMEGDRLRPPRRPTSLPGTKSRDWQQVACVDQRLEVCH